MRGLPQRYGGDAMFARHLNCQLGGKARPDLPEAVSERHHRHRADALAKSRTLAWFNHAAADHADVLLHAQNAVGVMSHEVGGHQRIGDEGGDIVRRGGGGKDVAREALKGRSLNGECQGFVLRIRQRI